jgi:hypothetical protein
MIEDNDLWMKKMREALKDYSEPPVPDGWSKLEAALNPVAKKRIHPYIWRAAAVLILAVSGISIFLLQTPVADDSRHTTFQTLTVTPAVKPETKEPAELIAQAKPEEQPANASKPHNRVPEVKGTEDERHVMTKEESDELPATVEIDTEEVNSIGHRPKNQPDNRDLSVPSGKDKLHLPVVSEKKRPSVGRWSIAASFSNTTGASSTRTQEYMFMADMPAAPSNGLASDMISIKDKQLIFEDGMPYLKGAATISEIKHKQPVSFGLSVRKQLSNGFSVESGVTYTLLSSEGKSVNYPSQKIEQKLHYIGIPLRGNWEFASSKRFMFYLTAGGMAEKCVYGKVGSDKQTIKPLQFSLSGGIGGQFNITNHIGIYMEPGISYFFDDRSDVETIRKETPANFNLQGGIRFTY